MKVFFERVRRGHFLRGVAIIVGGSALAQVLPTASMPLLARLYSPDEIGVLALYTAFISIVTPLGSLQYSKAIVSARDDVDAANLGIISLLLIVPTSLVFSLILWWLIGTARIGYGNLPAATVIFISISLILTSLFSVFRFWQIRVGGFMVVSRATVWQSIGRVTTQLLLGIAKAGWLGLVFGEVIGRGFGLRSLALRSSDLRAAIPNRNIWPEVRDTAIRYRKFPLISAPSMLLNTLALALPVPLISSGYSVSDAGQFSMAIRVMLLPMVLIGTAVGDVFHNRLAEYAREQPRLARPFFFKVSAMLAVVGMLPVLIVGLFGPDLWETVLGREWVVSGQIAQAIAPWVMVQFVVTPVSQVIPVYQRQELKLIYDGLALLSVVGVLLTGQGLGWPIVQTCTVLGVSQASVYVIYFVLLSRAVPNGEP